jgi:hypothetical protein
VRKSEGEKHGADERPDVEFTSGHGNLTPISGKNGEPKVSSEAYHGSVPMSRKNGETWAPGFAILQITLTVHSKVLDFLHVGLHQKQLKLLKFFS